MKGQKKLKPKIIYVQWQTYIYINVAVVKCINVWAYVTRNYLMFYFTPYVTVIQS